MSIIEWFHKTALETGVKIENCFYSVNETGYTRFRLSYKNRCVAFIFTSEEIEKYAGNVDEMVKNYILDQIKELKEKADEDTEIAVSR